MDDLRDALFRMDALLSLLDDLQAAMGEPVEDEDMPEDPEGDAAPPGPSLELPDGTVVPLGAPIEPRADGIFVADQELALVEVVLERADQLDALLVAAGGPHTPPVVHLLAQHGIYVLDRDVDRARDISAAAHKHLGD